MGIYLPNQFKFYFLERKFVEIFMEEHLNNFNKFFHFTIKFNQLTVGAIFETVD